MRPCLKKKKKGRRLSTKEEEKAEECCVKNVFTCSFPQRDLCEKAKEAKVGGMNLQEYWDT